MATKNINTNKNNINIKILLDKVRKTEKKIKKAEKAGGQAPVQQQVVVQPPPPPQPQFYRVAMPNYGNRPYLQDQTQMPQELQSNFDSFDAERQALVQSYLEQAQNIAGVPEDTSASVLPAEQEVPAELPAEQQAVPKSVDEEEPETTPAPQAPPQEAPAPTLQEILAEGIQTIPPDVAPVASMPVAPQTAPQVQEIQNLMEGMTVERQPQQEPPSYLQGLLSRPLSSLLAGRDAVQNLQRLGFEPMSVERRGQNRIQITNPLNGRKYFIDTAKGREVIQERRQDIMTGVYPMP